MIGQKTAPRFACIYSTPFPPDLLWSGADRPSAELALQSIVIDHAEKNRLSLITFGAMPPAEETSQETIAIDIEVKANLSDVYNFLNTLASVTPRVAVSSLRLRRSLSFPQQDGETPMFLQATIWGFWKANDDTAS